MEKILVQSPTVKYHIVPSKYLSFPNIATNRIDVYEYLAINSYFAKMIRFPLARTYRTAYLFFVPPDTRIVQNEIELEVHGGITYSSLAKNTPFYEVFKDFGFTLAHNCWVLGIDFSHFDDISDIESARRYIDAMQFHPDKKIREYQKYLTSIRETLDEYANLERTLSSIRQHSDLPEGTVKTHDFVFNELQRFEYEVRKYIESRGETLLPIIES